MFLNISSYAGGKVRLYQAIPGIFAASCCIKNAHISQVANMETKHSIFHFLPSNLRWNINMFFVWGDDPI